MGKKLIIKGADFSDNAITPTLEEQLMSLLNNHAQSLGFREGSSNTNIYNVMYDTKYSNNRCSIDNGGILITDITALGITSFSITPLDNYRGAFAIGNSVESIINNKGIWTAYTKPFTINFANHNGKNWLEEEGNVYILIEVIQKLSDTTEVLEVDFSKYFMLEVLS